MTRKPLTAWFAYAGAGLLISVLVATVAELLVEGDAARAIWISAGVAYTLQLAAFALLLAFRRHAQLFMAGWLGGMVLRFGGLAACAYWVSRSELVPRSVLLMSLVGFVFLLLMLEPVFLRWDARRT